MNLTYFHNVCCRPQENILVSMQTFISICFAIGDFVEKQNIYILNRKKGKLHKLYVKYVLNNFNSLYSQ